MIKNIEVRTKRQEIDSLKGAVQLLDAAIGELDKRIEKLEAARVAAAKEAKKPTKKAK